MSSTHLYRLQAAEQQLAAEAAVLENVRERCQRASHAWTVLADRNDRADEARAQIRSEKLLDGLSENPDRGRAAR